MKLRLSPITRKRLHRFVRHRRALVSTWIFAAISLAALVANLLANSNPIVVRMHGKLFFPAFRFYPESVFLDQGRNTPPDYKAMHALPIFTENKQNFMIFAPIPYGPSETIDEAKLSDQSGNIQLELRPIARAASLDITPELEIARHVAAEFFLGLDSQAIPGTPITQIWDVMPEWQDAITARFNNTQSPAFITSITPEHLDGIRVDVSLPPFRPRSRPPSTVRMTIRLAETSLPQIQRMSITPQEGPLTNKKLWSRLREQDQKALLALTPQTIENAVPLEVEAGPYHYQVKRAAGITWPHPPVAGHPLGIDGAGRDVLARIIHGLRVSLFFSILLVSVSMTLGTLIGAIQGYYGGKTDILIQRTIEVWSAIPFLYVMILLGSVYGASFALLLFCYGLFNWIGISFYMRAEFLRLRNTPFVDAARVLGLHDHQIIFRHILPNALTPLITFTPFSLVGAIASLAALDYLGFGLPALTPSLGQLLHQAQTYRTAWWLTLYPSLTLFIVILLGVFIGEGVREACDPRPRIRLE